MNRQPPRTVTVCLTERHLQQLDEIGAELRDRSEPTSRSGVVRLVLNVGLAALADRLRKRGAGSDDEGPDGPGRVPVGAAA